MAKWQVEAYVNSDLESREVGSQIRCYRVFPEGEPERWIVETNPALPPEVQEETAILIADALFNLLGV